MPESWRRWDIRRMSPRGARRYVLLVWALGEGKMLLQLALPNRRRWHMQASRSLVNLALIVGLTWLVRWANERRRAPVGTVDGGRHLGHAGAQGALWLATAVEWPSRHPVLGFLLGGVTGSLVGSLLAARKRRSAARNPKQADAATVESGESASKAPPQPYPPQRWDVRQMSTRGAAMYAALLVASGWVLILLNVPFSGRGLRWYNPITALAWSGIVNGGLVWSARWLDRRRRSGEARPDIEHAES